MSRWAGVTLEDRFWSRVHKTEDCWLWTGSSTGTNLRYGAMFRAGRMVNAHRISYELAYGPIADGMVIDHICHVHKCVRPDHLQAVTQKQNLENLQGARPGSKSGVRGVSWHKTGRKWKAQVTHNSRAYHVGLFTDLAEAEAAVIAKRNELFTNNLADRAA